MNLDRSSSWSLFMIAPGVRLQEDQRKLPPYPRTPFILREKAHLHRILYEVHGELADLEAKALLEPDRPEYPASGPPRS